MNLPPKAAWPTFATRRRVLPVCAKRETPMARAMPRDVMDAERDC